jgi:succinate dehydrogenase flavin-adding protein (antitoxin of CptAB toxin-antitoxin module)
MMKKDVKFLKKQVIYRCSYTGIKETDLFYKKIFLKKLDDFTYTDLNQILYLFKNFSDPEIFTILTGKKNPPIKLKKIFKKLMNA